MQIYIKKIQEYCKLRKMELPWSMVLDIAAEMMLNPDIDVRKAIRNVRKLNKISPISLNAPTSYDDRPLIEKIDSSAYNKKKKEKTRKFKINLEDYLLQISPERRDFIKGLLEKQLSSMEEIIADLSPLTLEDRVKEWETGSLKKGKMPREEYEKEFIVFLKDYVMKKRVDYLTSIVGKENIGKIKSKYRNLFPIQTMKRNYAFLKKIGLEDSKIAWQPGLLGTSEEKIKCNYKKLKELGLRDDKIVSQAHLLGMNPESVERNYRKLKDLGLSDRKIATLAHLLGMNPESVERNYRKLKDLGLSDRKIASQAYLLTRSQESIERNYRLLKRFGLKDSKIATLAHLLGRNPKSIERNYQHHVRLLRNDYRDRSSGRDLLLDQAQLLGIPKETIEANIQYLSYLEIKYKANLLGTNPQTKRKKMAWMLRELFDYREVPQQEKRKVIDKLYDFVRDDYSLLARSLASLEKNKNKLRKKVQNYINST